MNFDKNIFSINEQTYQRLDQETANLELQLLSNNLK